MSKRKLPLVLLVLIVVVVGVIVFRPKPIRLNGAGATFPAVLYTRWFAEYQKLTGVETNYGSVGSGQGIQSIVNQLTDFGATDGAMEESTGNGGVILHIPTALGAVVPIYNVEGISNETPLKFTPETLCRIYLGEITRWNDAALLVDNPQLGAIDQPITTVSRSDGSGTTNIFTSYLSAVCATWESSVGFGNSVDWPSPNTLGGKGNEGVTGSVKQTPFSIGYVELAYAEQNGLPIGEVQNQAGNFVRATTESISLAAEGVQLPDDMRVKIVNAAGADAYPIAGFTWILIYQNQTDQAKGQALVNMLWWAIHDAQSYNAGLGYAPLSQSAVDHAEALLQSITINGQAVVISR